MSLTKKQKRKRALRRAACDYGFDGLFFIRSCSGWNIKKLAYDEILRCTSKPNYGSYGFISSPGTLREILSGEYQHPSGEKFKPRVYFEDEKMEFESLDEFKMYLLIRKISGV